MVRLFYAKAFFKYVLKKKKLWNSFAPKLFDAAGRTRTGTAVNRLILSQVRLPIPPLRHKFQSLGTIVIILVS